MDRRIGVAEDGDYQALLPSHGYAQVDLVLQDNPVVLPRGVHLGGRAEGLGHGLEDEGEVSQVDAFAFQRKSCF